MAWEPSVSDIRNINIGKIRIRYVSIRWVQALRAAGRVHASIVRGLGRFAGCNQAPGASRRLQAPRGLGRPAGMDLCRDGGMPFWPPYTRATTMMWVPRSTQPGSRQASSSISNK